jgi:hypothetical protein
MPQISGSKTGNYNNSRRSKVFAVGKWVLNRFGETSVRLRKK